MTLPEIELIQDTRRGVTVLLVTWKGMTQEMGEWQNSTLAENARRRLEKFFYEVREEAKDAAIQTAVQHTLDVMGPDLSKPLDFDPEKGMVA